MLLIAGLGNPGPEYVGTRHNMGFMVLDRLADLLSVDFDKSRFKGVYGILKNPELPDDVILVKPQTFMNLSGECVEPLTHYYKIPVEDIVIVYDDMALKEGEIRLRENGTSGGHNGMQNIIDRLGTSQIKRLRIGIGEPEHSGVDWALTKPSADVQPAIEEALDQAVSALKDIMTHSFQYAMTHHNGKAGKP